LMMNFKLRTVSLASIDLADHTCRITTKTSIDDLIDSIKAVGLMSPPLLLKTEKKTDYTVVSGFRRIAACRALGWSQVQARLMNSEETGRPDTTRLECIKLAITDNALQRPLNLIEQSRSLYLLSEYYEDIGEMVQTASSLGLPENPSMINRIKTICRLPLLIQEGILADTISLAMALELGKLERPVGKAFAKLFEDLKLSLSKQREIVTLAGEIALRDDISILDLFDEKYLQEVLCDEALDRNQKAGRIRLYLKQRRFPAITAAEQRFDKYVKDLKLDSNTKLVPPRNFEGTTYSFNFYFKDLPELKERQKALEKIIQNPAIEKILTR
jgi:ParB family chromosome partitioning protein